MKASELMTEDWVDYNGTYQQIEEINGTDNQVYLTEDEVVDCPDVYPIPLTKEILEKNGWVWNNLPFEQYWEQYGLCLYYAGNGYRIVCGINVCMMVDSVHQLQHALKICGIEKEIEL